ncbi:uncharacterized protein LOC114840851 [Esox lucius]|uniref:uncharacterized protein LOC114840851 n=1 Tax=Esox lucius TaxID=8010 RepID=UPI0014768765|nr:uncharacterized protein LOC114840851 [Esox lucius]
MREAGQRVRPNLSRFTVASIIRTYRQENRTARRPAVGGRQRVFTHAQELAVVNLVVANNAITLRQLRERILEDQAIFHNVHSVSTTTLARVLREHHVSMKQLYNVPFERNSVAVKNLRYDYVQTVLAFDAAAQQHEYIYIDEAGFNLAKTRRRGRNIIGQRAIVNIPGQRGGNITMCAAIGGQGLLHHHATLGPYNTAHLLAFLDALHAVVTQDRPGQPMFVVIWDNVSFHRAALVRDWFANHDHFMVLHLPPYSPFLNPIEEFFSAWRWKVYDRLPHVRVPLLRAMEEACGDIEVGSIHGWIRHTRRYFPRCLGREDIACDVDEVLWPDPNRRRDP